MQHKHPYDYAILGKWWRENGKKLARDWPYVWACENPKTRRMVLLTGEHPEDAPTRVPIVETWHTHDAWVETPPGAMDDALKWRVMHRLIEEGAIVLAEKNVGPVGIDYLEALLEREYMQNDNDD